MKDCKRSKGKEMRRQGEKTDKNDDKNDERKRSKGGALVVLIPMARRYILNTITSVFLGQHYCQH